MKVTLNLSTKLIETQHEPPSAPKPKSCAGIALTVAFYVTGCFIAISLACGIYSAQAYIAGMFIEKNALNMLKNPEEYRKQLLNDQAHRCEKAKGEILVQLCDLNVCPEPYQKGLGSRLDNPSDRFKNFPWQHFIANGVAVDGNESSTDRDRKQKIEYLRLSLIQLKKQEEALKKDEGAETAKGIALMTYVQAQMSKVCASAFKQYCLNILSCGYIKATNPIVLCNKELLNGRAELAHCKDLFDAHNRLMEQYPCLVPIDVREYIFEV